MVVRSIDFLILLILTPLVYVFFCSSIPTFVLFFYVFRSCSIMDEKSAQIVSTCDLGRPGRRVMAGGVLHPTRWNSIVVFYALFSIMMTNNDVNHGLTQLYKTKTKKKDSCWTKPTSWHPCACQRVPRKHKQPILTRNTPRNIEMFTKYS